MSGITTHSGTYYFLNGYFLHVIKGLLSEFIQKHEENVSLFILSFSLAFLHLISHLVITQYTSMVEAVHGMATKLVSSQMNARLL